jgi:hypothetical protein
MEKTIRSIAVRSAVMIFFIMASVSSLCGVSPATTSKRAFLGAVIVYFIISITGKIVASILIDQAIQAKFEKLNPPKKEAE